MRVALFHDYLTHFGGAERVLLALMELFPNAPVFTLVHDESKFDGIIDESRIRTSFLQKVPGATKAHKYLPLAMMPMAVEQFDLSDFDVVLSATHSFGKGLITDPSTLHISYCFTPTRYAWDDSHRYIREFSTNTFFQKLAPVPLSYIRLWDYFAAQRVDEYITLSEHVAKRIRKYYRRDAKVIEPPVDIEKFDTINLPGSYYLIVSRLVPYKKIELAIEACEKLGRPLVIVGTGPELKLLKLQAGIFTVFKGFVAEEELPALYQGAKALLFPQEEDFGITPVEAAASGIPTIAWRAGGAVETVQENRTGLFFNEQNAENLMKTIIRFESKEWDRDIIRGHANYYRTERFWFQMEEAVNLIWQNRKNNMSIKER